MPLPLTTSLVLRGGIFSFKILNPPLGCASKCRINFVAPAKCSTSDTFRGSEIGFLYKKEILVEPQPSIKVSSRSPFEYKVHVASAQQPDKYHLAPFSECCHPKEEYTEICKVYANLCFEPLSVAISNAGQKFELQNIWPSFDSFRATSPTRYQLICGRVRTVANSFTGLTRHLALNFELDYFSIVKFFEGTLQRMGNVLWLLLTGPNVGESLEGFLRYILLDNWVHPRSVMRFSRLLACFVIRARSSNIIKCSTFRIRHNLAHFIQHDFCLTRICLLLYHINSLYGILHFFLVSEAAK